MTRTRSEYRLSPIPTRSATTHRVAFVHPDESHREELAVLLLDAYRGTIDDEGEGPNEARDAIDYMLHVGLRDHSIVVPSPGEPGLIAFCSVVIVEELHYIDPIVVAAAHKSRGVGRQVVAVVLDSLGSDGIDEVGAVITDGNHGSERLFAGLGFVRHGRWG